MNQSSVDRDKFLKSFLLVLVVAISAIFVVMIRQFLEVLLLAAILTGLISPLYQRLLTKLRGRRRLASITTLLIVLLVVVVPLVGFLGIVGKEAFRVSGVVTPWIEEQVRQPGDFEKRLGELIPFMDRLSPYRSRIYQTLGKVAVKAGKFLFDKLSAITKGTVAFFFYLFVMLYAMFFFLISGRSILDKFLYYTPLPSAEKNRMLDKFVSVTRATVKGTLVIGILQGALGGIAFAIVGIQGAAFWGTVMAVLSIIPGLGTALVWIPAVVYLLVAGQVGAGIGLAAWCAGMVSTVDNFLRPMLVGKDTKMPDLLILLGTFGGLILFGAIGFIVGPVIAALFVTVWDMYGTAFREVLGEPEQANAEGGATTF